METGNLKFSDGEVAEVSFVTLRKLQTDLINDPTEFVPHREEYRMLFEVLQIAGKASSKDAGLIGSGEPTKVSLAESGVLLE